MYTSERFGNVDKIVRVLRKYGQITISQGMKLLELNEYDTRSNFKTAVRQKLALECGTDAIVLNSLNVMGYDKKLEKAMDLMVEIATNNDDVDFWQSIKEVDNDPCLIFFPAEADIYDIMYIENGKEKMYNNKMKRLKMDSNFLVIIESEEQKEELDFEGIKGFYLVKDGGLVSIE